jgi:hypothetical protein
MTLGSRISSYLGTKSQKTVAGDWLQDRPVPEGREQLELGTAASQLNRLLRHDDPGAVRFFFGSREDAKRLFDVLQVPEAERASLLEAADALLENGGPPVRLVADLSALSSDRDSAIALFEAIGDKLVRTKIVSPAVLVMTERQYDVLPRSFDDASEWLEIVRVPDPASGRARAVELAGSHVLVMSPWTFQEPARWLAASFEKRALVLEPRDGLEVFAKAGGLPWPTVLHDLSAIVADTPNARVRVDVPATGPERRRLMHALRDEEAAVEVDSDPRVRLALARALGTEATSTERERTEVELRAAAAVLDVAPTRSNEAELTRRLEAAGRRITPTTVLRVGDVLHVINPTTELPLERHPRITVHRVEPAVPAVVRLRDAAVGSTREELLQDPTLTRLVDRLDPDLRERLAFLHARASLLSTGALMLPPDLRQPVPVQDAAASLARLLAGDPPAAALRVSVPQGLEDFVADADGWSSQKAWAERHLVAVPEPVAGTLSAVPPVTNREPITLVRGGRLLWVALTGLRSYDSRSLRLPKQASDALDANNWLDHLEWSTALQPEPTLARQNLTPYGSGPEPYTGGWAAFTSPFEAPESLWREADLHVAATWIALRRGLAEAVPIGNGEVVVPVGGGICAVVVMETTTDARAATLPVPLAARSVRIYDKEPAVSPWKDAHWGITRALCLGLEAGGVELRAEVPSAVTLTGAGVRAEIRFKASSLLFGESTSAGARGALVGGWAAEQERQAEERRQQEDGDD